MAWNAKINKNFWNSRQKFSKRCFSGILGFVSAEVALRTSSVSPDICKAVCGKTWFGRDRVRHRREVWHRQREAKTWWVTENGKQSTGEAETESSMNRLAHIPYQAETGEAQAESRRDPVNQRRSQAETWWITPCKADSGWGTVRVRLRLCELDNSSVGFWQSLLLIGRCQVKFGKNVFIFFPNFRKIKKRCKSFEKRT
jgi:hypothetical protein